MKTVGQIAAEWKEDEEAKKKLAEVTAERDWMRIALEKIIEMNRQTALDKYGDAERAEPWACVVVAREAIQSLTAHKVNHAKGLAD